MLWGGTIGCVETNLPATQGEMKGCMLPAVQAVAFGEQGEEKEH